MTQFSCHQLFINVPITEENKILIKKLFTLESISFISHVPLGKSFFSKFGRWQPELARVIFLKREINWTGNRNLARVCILPKLVNWPCIAMRGGG